MRWSEALIPTLKETPAEAEVASHVLMIRAGLIRKLAAGTYSYLPLGLRILKKVEKIIKEEMDAEGAQEVLLPAIHPAELWKKTGRFQALGQDMISFKDRHGKENVLGPTHEEVITELVAREVRSYRELPLILYQIQTKFRDETRPRFGVIRSREFIMKDAYSFDCDVENLNKSYQKMYRAYCRIFDRCGLSYIAVEADPGFMGGDVSHEFMVPSKDGEDVIVQCGSCAYAASLEKAECLETQNSKRKRQNSKGKRQNAKGKRQKLKPLKEVDTPGVTTIEKVSALLKVPPQNLVKTLIYKADDRPVAILVRGDHDVNEAKLKRALDCQNLEMADEATIKDVTGGPVGYSGPVGLKGNVRMMADYGISDLQNFVTGANKKDAHLINVNMKRDFQVEEWSDLRFITETDSCPKCKAKIQVKHAIEVGHTFKLGTKYSKALEAKFLDRAGKEKVMIMGCYGIGVNRIIAALVEQGHDKDGIIWPVAISPYEVLVLPTNSADKEISSFAQQIYKELTNGGLDVLLDDRDERAGSKFKDADLIGVPVQIIVGQKLSKGIVEIKIRKGHQVAAVDKKECLNEVKKKLRKILDRRNMI